jgi:hypothetical protein
MLGFTETITEIVQALRVSELRLSTRFRKLLCVRVALANSTTTLSPCEDTPNLRIYFLTCLSQILILFVHLELSYPTWSIV